MIDPHSQTSNATAHITKVKDLGGALVILSGGQDSTTALFEAVQRYETVRAITFNYGQRHQRELVAAAHVAQLAGVQHEFVLVPGILLGQSPLVSDEPLERYESYEQMDKTIGDRVELTFVPMRNALFFVIAANRAACYGINTLITGICQADNANYPDCRESFRAAMENTINTALGRDDFVLRAPLLYNSKAQTVRLAYELPGCTTALAFSHTSYDGEYPPVDMNHANVLRAQGFLEANLPDPLVLRAALLDELMPLPETKNYFGVRNDPQFRDLLADIGYHANQWL